MNKKRRCLMLIAMSLSLFSCNSKKTVFPDYMYEEDNEVMDEYSLKDVNNFKSEKEDINKAFKDNYVDDINLINNNNVKYINSVDYDIKSYKIGYYVMDGTKLIEIISNSLDLDTEIKLSEVINNFASFNITEKNKNNEYFTYKKKKLINDGLYLIIEAKTSSGEQIVSNIKLNVTKISKY
mgnify:CR=1 FL=1